MFNTNNLNNLNNLNNNSLSRGQVLLLNNMMTMYQSNNSLINDISNAHNNNVSAINSLLATNNRLTDIVIDAFQRRRNNPHGHNLFYFTDFLGNTEAQQQHRNHNHNNNANYDFLRMFTNFLDPIEIHPTPAQIEDATRVVRFGDIVGPMNDSCPISLNRFAEDDSVTVIRHCNHVFNTAELNNWFLGNCKCPVCRYDIRTYTEPRNIVVTDLSNNNVLHGIRRNSRF
jgi:hypothetical protein